jgi:magnesium transporter
MKHASRRSKKRRKPHFHRRTKPGASPGTVETHPDAPRPVIRVIAYSPSECVEEEVSDPNHLPEYVKRFPVAWINVDGLGDARIIQRIGELFGIHPLALEDVVNAHQRAKVEDYEEQLFIVARMMHNRGSFETEQLSMFLGERFLLTFQERQGDCLDPVRERIRKDSGKIRRMKPDYLAYAVIDTVIDSYFPLAEHLGDDLDRLEDDMIARYDPGLAHGIHTVRNELMLMRRTLRPHREAVNQLVRDPHRLVTDETRVFLRDCYDHTVQLIDLMEAYREMCVDLRDFHISLVSQRMNEIMKVLTLIATIFMPLSFIAGLYGMNFNPHLPGNMPELNWPFAYVGVLTVMAGVVIGLLIYFRRKRWIGQESVVDVHEERDDA